MMLSLNGIKTGLRRIGIVAGLGGVLLAAPQLAVAQPGEAESSVEGEAGASETSPPAADAPHASPQEVFEQARIAYNQRDWIRFVETVSPTRRDELIGQFAVTFATLAQQPEADPRIADVVERHVPKDLDPMDLVMTSQDTQAELIRLARRMRDGQGFFAEAMSLAFAMEFGAEADDVQLTTLADVVVDEAQTSAVGKVTIETPDGPREDSWTFEKFEDAWYLSMK